MSSSGQNGDLNSPQHKDFKPLMRGWSHALAAVGAVLVTLIFVWRAQDNPLRWFSLLIYGLCMVELYMGSAIYHLGHWKGKTRKILQSLDHANIFVMIAGTFTPICLIYLDGYFRIFVVGTIWTLAIIGVASAVLTLRLPRWLQAGLYILMGCFGIIPQPVLVQRLPNSAIELMAFGGILYILGAVVYALRRPNPLPRVFGFHEIFHLFVIAGSVLFAIVIWVWVASISS